MRYLSISTLVAGVAIAAADSSIVVLALPALLAHTDASIESVAWVVTSYNLALAVGSLALLRIRSRRVGQAGALVFCVSSLACAAAPDVWSLIAFRALQGLGGAALLLGATSGLRSLTATRAAALWTGAGVAGAALGPALGGALTQWLGWRSIFAVQAPVALLCVRFLSGSASEPPVRGRVPLRPAAALAFASASLVALLFLAVVELIDVRGLSPLAASGVASVIPLAALAATPLAKARSGAGAIALAGGLAGMALLPGPSLAWPLVALALAGLGYGLLVPGIAHDVLLAAGPARTLALRHVGLVAGLLLLTPILTRDLDAAGNTAELRGIATVLQAPAGASQKIRVAIAVAPVLARPSREGVPDFSAAITAHGSDLAGLAQALQETVRATLTRAFRRSFLLAALLALVAASLTVGRRGRHAATATALAALALAGGEIAAGAPHYGTRPALAKPCADKGGGPGYAVLDFIACHRHENREQLIADAAAAGTSAVAFLSRLERLRRLIP